MLTQHDKNKEFFEHIIKNSDMECLSYKNKHFDPNGVAIVMTYEYVTQYEYQKHNKKSIDNIFVRYNKWFVENYDYVKGMNLPGCEKHNKLLGGSGVYVHSDKFGDYTFYNKYANDIINACEDRIY